MLNKEIVKGFYLEGYNAAEIAKKLKVGTDSVRKCIQRNFGNLKLKHQVEVFQKK